jgi:hypothetical protein
MMQIAYLDGSRDKLTIMLHEVARRDRTFRQDLETEHGSRQWFILLFDLKIPVSAARYSNTSNLLLRLQETLHR